MAARQRAVATLPTLMRALKTNNNNSINKLPNTPLPSLRRAFSLYDQINLIDNVPEDQLRFQGYTIYLLYIYIQFYLIFQLRMRSFLL